jgi:lipoprotein-anchoring transpeptidase ErfK/SrfK
MLLALLFTALSATASLPADSVRAAAKHGAVRPDTTLPVPAIAAPKQPAPEVVLPIRPLTSATQPTIAPEQAPARAADVVQQSAPSATVASNHTVDAKPSAPSVSVLSTVTAAALSAASKDSTAKVIAAPTLATVHESNQIVDAKPGAATATVDAKPTSEIKPPVVAPADAVAATPRNVMTTRVDPRTVVSVSSSERFEPLYAVPLPSARVRLTAPAAADSIVVYKRERTLVLFNRGVPVRNYFIALGSKPVGDKERAGDQRTPEGVFYVNAHNPASKFHLALRISYPDDAHRARAAKLGVDPGGDIMIHGLPKDFSEAGKAHQQNDWTNGCVALSNQEIEEIWRAVPDGTPVQIKP